MWLRMMHIPVWLGMKRCCRGVCECQHPLFGIGSGSQPTPDHWPRGPQGWLALATVCQARPALEQGLAQGWGYPAMKLLAWLEIVMKFTFYDNNEHGGQ
jgi:hypothetical protein